MADLCQLNVGYAGHYAPCPSRNRSHSPLCMACANGLVISEATTASVLQWQDRPANLAAPATDVLALSLDENRLPKRLRRRRS